MEIGNEISQKIRSAIKAKLVELGAYVDDELPDYIMVMVANKKSKAHMTEDLNLFLGNNTDRFTTWLHSLLQKLKSITVDQSKGSVVSTEDTGQQDEGLQQESDEVDAKQYTVETSFPIESPEITEQQRKQIEEEKEVERALEALEEDELTLQPDTDEFAEEEKIVAATKQSKLGKPTAVASKMKPQIVASQAKEAIVKALSDPGRSKTVIRSSSKDSTKVTTTKEVSRRSNISARTVTKSSKSSETESSTGSRKRKAPGSVIGSIIKRDDEEEDEEYNPHKPQYGRVASTVKVGLRRPSVPPSKQASKSLLMKAVSEAKTSIEKTTKKGIVEPVRRPEGRSSVHSRLGNAVSDARNRLGSHRSSGRRRSSPERTTSSRSRMRSDEIEVKKSETEVKRSLSSRSKREEVKDRLASDKIKRTRSDPGEDSKRASPSRVKEDCRVFESKSDGGSEAGDEEPESRTIQKKERSESPQLELLIQSGAEDSDFTDEEPREETSPEESSKTVVQEPTSEGREKAASPKFVVSLDGIDPEMVEKFEGRMDDDIEGDGDLEEDEELMREEEAEMDEEEAAMRARNIVRVRPMQVLMGDNLEVAPKRRKLAEKCKFWPACRSGNECQYHHPTTPCKAFPNCSFGDKCNYIHPNCMFDANCTRPNCPYTHASKKKTPQASPPIIIQPIKMVPVSSTPLFPPRPAAPTQAKNPSGKVTCKFFPKCTNMTCPFYHPKPCRFGFGCRNRLIGCPFVHPPLPSKDQLKWTPSSRPTAPAEPDDSLDTVVIEQADIGNQSDEEDESVNINL